MANLSNTVEGLKSKLIDLRTYWNIPMPGRYMTFKEIGAYAGGGIGAYFLIYMGNQLTLNTNNMVIGDAIGVSPTHMYILYIIATLASIPLTAIRANMIDNSKNRAGKYRPYLISMGIPTALIAIAYVWFPYEYLDKWFPQVAYTDPKTGAAILMGYIVKCAVVLLMNFLLQFFFSFFNDSYTNLIHVLSPNTQERTDVLSIKSVVYSLAPSLANIILPLIADAFTNNDMYNIKVYRIGYPIFAVLGFALSCIVYVNTKEKIVQAKTRVAQVRFLDAFKAVAKNKYFWIIALAGWLGFLEGSYGQIMSWVYTYGHATSGKVMGVINTVVGNASMWGMIIAPFCIRAFGKKKVLLGVNFMNIVCILAMGLNKTSIYWLAVCVYFNWLFGAFEQITTPAIQADIRDYHQYKTGERIDGMFSTVQTIGNIVTLVTSLVIPVVYESYGIYQGNGYESPYDILDVTTGQAGLLEKVVGTLVLMAAFGAFMNMVPYFFYDLKEVQQKSIVRILKIRAMFEDYGNGVSNDRELVETIDYINKAREYHGLEKKSVTKADKKADKKAYKEALAFNEEIEIANMVMDELNKFSLPLYQAKVAAYTSLYNGGLRGLYEASMSDIISELSAARALPKNTKEEKELRSFAIEIAQHKKASRKAIDKNYKSFADFVEPDYSALDRIFDEEEEVEAALKDAYLKQSDARKEKDYPLVKDYTDKIKALEARKKELADEEKAEMGKHTQFAQAAKPYLDAKKLMTEMESYKHLDELEARYDEAKANAEADLAAKIAEQKRLEEEKAARTKQLREEKELAKAAKKENKKK
ncbi:MAG: hypothetical protein E7558_06045 [Ruminococcaceae bacterium]|nr:hypothetical protein [Oscillospiraceae bacterium]